MPALPIGERDAIVVRTTQIPIRGGERREVFVRDVFVSESAAMPIWIGRPQATTPRFKTYGKRSRSGETYNCYGEIERQAAKWPSEFTLQAEIFLEVVLLNISRVRI